jgi:hypothetical protein
MDLTSIFSCLLSLRRPNPVHRETFRVHVAGSAAILDADDESVTRETQR